MEFKYISTNQVKNLPAMIGVYAFQSKKGVLLYVGKAINIKERVKNHFNQPTFKDNIFIPKTTKIGFIVTGSEIEALLLEAKLIKKYLPKYNTQWKDGKNYYFVAITAEIFPRVFTTHQRSTNKPLTLIGPFVDGQALKQTLRVLRRVFPYRTCKTLPKKVCLYKEMKLCPAPCQLKVQSVKLKVRKNIKNLIKILRGQKNSVIRNLQKEMRLASQKQNYEKAQALRDQIMALENIFSHSHILRGAEEATEWLPQKLFNDTGPFYGLQKVLGTKNKIKRIEGYDISNIQGQQATGSMVVFENGLSNKNEYRKFHIKIEGQPNDTAMLKEMISRRLKHKEWPMPQVMLIDGGKGQLNTTLTVVGRADLPFREGLPFPDFSKVISLAKRKNELFIEGKDKPILLKNLPPETANLILRIRDEAHRFAIAYHKKLRSKSLLI
ncbi:MAG: GIY-YIG nuclease family protein [Candidatus Gribaldobacteria bacterium]|nr:GIY-YIG nuclease family protein [Candidatus Gribaldobacteria bacterium]